MPDLSGDIAQQAVEPITSATDGQSATGRSLADIILADQYLASKAAIRKKRRGIVYTKQLPSGAMSDQGGSNGGGPNFTSPFGGGF